MLAGITPVVPADAPLDALFDVDPGAAGKVAAAVAGRRAPLTDAQAALVRLLVPAGLVRLFRDGAETWVEVDD